jgi:hypothetical protein
MEFSIEHLLVKKEQRAQCLVLRRRGNVSIYSKVGEKSGDFLLAHVAGMPFAVKKNKATDPIDADLFSANAVMLYPQLPAHAVKQLWRGSDGSVGGLSALHSLPILIHSGRSRQSESGDDS